MFRYYYHATILALLRHHHRHVAALPADAGALQVRTRLLRIPDVTTLFQATPRTAPLTNRRTVAGTALPAVTDTALARPVTETVVTTAMAHPALPDTDTAHPALDTVTARPDMAATTVPGTVARRAMVVMAHPATVATTDPAMALAPDTAAMAQTLGPTPRATFSVPPLEVCSERSNKLRNDDRRTLLKFNICNFS